MNMHSLHAAARRLGLDWSADELSDMLVLFSEHGSAGLTEAEFTELIKEARL